MNMVNTTYNSTEDMINKLQKLKGKTKLKFYRNVSNYYDEMKHKKFQTQEDHFAKNAQGISKTYHEVLWLMKLLQAKPKVNTMNNKYYYLYYNVIKSRDEKEIVNDYISFIDFITPNHNISIKPGETKLR